MFAYLDAGSGSLLLQALLGGVAGIAVAFRAWKARLAGRSQITEGADTEEASLPSE